MTGVYIAPLGVATLGTCTCVVCDPDLVIIIILPNYTPLACVPVKRKLSTAILIKRFIYTFGKKSISIMNKKAAKDLLEHQKINF